MMSYKRAVLWDQCVSKSENSKAPYARPILVEYGSLTKITKTAAGSSEDGGTDPFGFPQFSGLEG